MTAIAAGGRPDERAKMVSRLGGHRSSKLHQTRTSVARNKGSEQIRSHVNQGTANDAKSGRQHRHKDEARNGHLGERFATVKTLRH